MAHLLIVEDEDQVRVLAEGILQDRGHTTLSASTFDQALALLEGAEPLDLIFTDIGLQSDIQAGLMLAQEAIKRKRDAPVLYTTGQGLTDGMQAMFVDRAKNLLALVQATVQLTQADTVKDFKAAIEGRLQALSNAHTLLAQSRWAGANLHTLVMEELAPYRSAETSRAHINGPEFVLEPKSAQTIAIVLHELTTNAVKYGALSVPSGRLRVEWSRGETQLVIRWSEADGPPVKPPSRQGFGTRVIGRVVQTNLRVSCGSIGIPTGSLAR